MIDNFLTAVVWVLWSTLRGVLMILAFGIPVVVVSAVILKLADLIALDPRWLFLLPFLVVCFIVGALLND